MGGGGQGGGWGDRQGHGGGWGGKNVHNFIWPEQCLYGRVNNVFRNRVG